MKLGRHFGGHCRTISAKVAAFAAAFVVSFVCVTAPATAQTLTEPFTTPATAESWTVPDGVDQITITARGGAGGTRGTAPGGGGATVEGTFAVTAGDTVYLIVGEQGEDGGEFDAGGGGSTGVFINGTLVMVAGGGGGSDNTDNNIASGGQSGLDGAGSGDGSGCTAIPGGTNGNGGPGGGLIPAGCNRGTNGGSGGGGIFSAGQVGGGGAGGGEAADLNPLDGFTVAQGGAAGAVNGDISNGGARGGAGFTGGGGSQARESGGGGGYSGGAGGNPSSKPGGGGSFLDASATSGTITAGSDSVDTGDGLVTITYSIPDLVTKKTLLSGDATPATGDVVTFAIDVVNGASGRFRNLSLTDLIPSGLTATANNGTVTQGSYDSGTGVWTIGRLRAGESARLIIEGTVDADQLGNTITNTTTAAAGSPTDSSTAGDDLTESVVVTNEVDLSITKTNGTTEVVSGSTTTYTLTVSHNGRDTISGAVVADTPGAGISCAASAPVTITGDGVPSGSFTFSDLSSGGIALGILSAGQSTTLSYSCQVN